MKLSGTKTGSINQYNGLGDQLYDIAGERPTLDLNFADKQSLNDQTTGKSLVTHSRSSNATYVGGDGLIKDATTNAPRFDHDPETGESLGLLVEESRTNEFPNNTDIPSLMTGGSATKTSVTISTPDGDASGHAMLTDASAFATNYRSFTTSGTNDEVDGTLSFYAKKKTSGTATLTVTMEGGGVARGVFNRPIDSTSWTRVTATKDYAGATSRSRRFDIYLPSGSSSDGNTEFYICFVQFENGSFPTSYIRTSGSTATRAADIAQITGSNFTSFYNQSEGTFFCSTFAPKGDVVYGTGDTFDNTQYVTAQTTFNVSIRSSGANSAILTAPVSATGTTNIAHGYAANNFAAVSNGGTVSTDTNGAVPLAQVRLKLGSSAWAAGADNEINGTIKRLSYWSRRLSNDTLQKLTS